MNTAPSVDPTIEKSLQLLAPQELNAKNFTKDGIVFEAVFTKDKISEVSKNFLNQGYYLENQTAVDFSECVELVYHFARYQKNDRCAIKVVLDKNDASVSAPTISNVYKSADWYEREIREMFGVTFEGHKNPKNLLLPDSSTIHPLLKSFKGEPKGSDLQQSLQLINEDKKDFQGAYQPGVVQENGEYYLNLGPQHPSTHGVLRLLLKLNGERVISAEPVIGYSHRHQEKMMEVQTYPACWPNFGRLDYVGAMSYNFGYALAIERAMGIAPPPRVEAIRVLTSELNHIASHLLWMGTFLLDLGAFTPFFYAFDDREKILDILEMVTGERLTYDYFRFGGVDHDIPEEFVPAVKSFISSFNSRIKDYENLVVKNIIFQKRTKGLGILSLQDALSYGVTGPLLRACGVEYDLRKHESYSLYPQLDFAIPTQKDSDVFSRFRVRFDEVKESIKIIRQLIDKIPAGPINLGKQAKNVAKGEYYSAVESARGLFGIHLISDGTLNPYRIKLRTPSFSNLNATIDMLKGNLISDMIAILGSVDIVLPEIDR